MAPPGTDQLESLFKAVDIDGDGQISETDLRTFMSDRVGCDVDDEQIKSLLKVLLASATKSGKSSAATARIDFSTFLAFFMKQLDQPLPAVLEDIFHLVDTNGDGRLSATELVAFAERVKVKIGIDTAVYLLSRGVTGADGRGSQAQAAEVDFQQFCALVQRSVPFLSKRTR